MDAKSWDARFDSEEFIYTKDVNRFVKELATGLEPGTAIDIAGGEGRNTVWLAERGWTVENIDFSRVALAKCEAFAAERSVAARVSTNLSDATNFAPNLGKVNLAVIAYLQIPMSLLEIAFGRAANALAPGGHLIGVWHARENLEAGFGGPRDPAVLPQLSELAKWCADSGLEVISLENRDGQIQTREGLKPSVTLVLLARRPGD